MPTKKEVRVLSKDLIHAIEWAAAEFNYIEKLKEELEEISKEKIVKKEIREINKAIRILRYIGKAERRAANFEEKVERESRDIYTELSKHLGFDYSRNNRLMEAIRKTIKEINIEHDSLLKYASMYEGLLRSKLKEAKLKAKEEARLQLLEYIKEEHSNEKARQIHASLMNLISDILKQVKDAEKWVGGLEASLKKAKTIIQQLSEQGKLCNEVYEERLNKLKEIAFKSRQDFDKVPKEYLDLLILNWDFTINVIESCDENKEFRNRRGGILLFCHLPGHINSYPHDFGLIIPYEKRIITQENLFLFNKIAKVGRLDDLLLLIQYLNYKLPHLFLERMVELILLKPKTQLDYTPTLTILKMYLAVSNNLDDFFKTMFKLIRKTEDGDISAMYNNDFIGNLNHLKLLSIDNWDKIIDTIIYISKVYRGKEEKHTFYLHLFGPYAARLDFLENIDDFIFVVKELCKLGDKVKFHNSTIEAFHKEFKIDKEAWLILIKTIYALDWAIEDTYHKPEFIRFLIGKKREGIIINEKFIIKAYVQFFNMGILIEREFKRTFRVGIKRVTMLVDVHWCKRALYKLIEEQKNKKDHNKQISYLINTNVNQIITDCVNFLIDNFRIYLRDHPNEISARNFYIKIVFNTEFNASFTGSVLKKTYPSFIFGLPLVLSSYLIEVIGVKDTSIRDKLRDKTTNEQFYGDGLRIFKEYYGLHDRTLYEVILHEFTHYIDYLNGKLTDSKLKISEKEYTSWSVLSLFVKQIRAECITRFRNERQLDFILFKQKEIQNNRKTITQLYTTIGGVSTDCYYIGSLMAYFIGLFILYLEDRERFSKLRVYYSGKDFLQMDAGWKTIFSRGETLYFKNLPLDIHEKTITEISKLEAMDLFNKYWQACEILGIAEEYQIVSKADLNKLIEKEERERQK